MRRPLQIFAAVAVTLGGLGAAVALAMAGRSAEADAPPPAAASVEVITLAYNDKPLLIEATGSVAADEAASLSAQVTGQVVEVSPKLVPGGRFQRGEVLARVDSRDYRYAVKQAEAQVEQARLELALESGRGDVARREWTMLGQGGEPSPLAVRAPQRAAAEASLASAEAKLSSAQLSLERTAIVAPFNALVVSESVDRGQVLSPGMGVINVVGADRLRVTVSVPLEVLDVLDVPGVDGGQGAKATVTQRLGAGKQVQREGEVISVGGQLDPQTRTAQLVVAIDEPLDGGGLPLLPGAFVDVTLIGQVVEGALSVPREAVTGDDQVWVVTGEGVLERRDLEVLWRGPEALWVTGGVAPGDRVVTTRMSLPIEGQAVRLLGEEG